MRGEGWDSRGVYVTPRRAWQGSGSPGRAVGSDDGGDPATAVVPIIVLPGEVGGGHEHEALVWAAVL